MAFSTKGLTLRQWGEKTKNDLVAMKLILYMGPQTVARWLLLEIPPSDHDPSQQGSTHPKIQEIGLSSKDCLVISIMGVWGAGGG